MTIQADANLHADGVAAPRRSVHEPWKRSAVVAVLLLLASALVIGLHVHRYTTLSPIDELQHYDYLVKASSGSLVRGGERVGQEAMREEACRGIDAAFQTPPCATDTFDPAHFQELGYNTASSQSPIYYATSGVVARVVRSILGLDSLFTAARLTGAFWLALGLGAVVALARRLGAPVAGMALACGVLLVSPVVLHAHATVNADAVLLAAGGGVLLAALVGEERRGWWFLAPVAAGFVAFAAEPTTIFASGTAALYLVIRALSSARNAPAKSVAVTTLVAFAVLAGAYASNQATGAFKKSIALDVGTVTLPKDEQLAAAEITSEHVLTAIPALMTPLRDPYLPAFLNSPSVRAGVRLTDMALVGTLVGVAALGGVRSRAGHLALALLVVGLVAGPLLVIYNFVTSSVYFPIPSRYGLSIAPAIMAVAATAAVKSSTVAVGGLLVCTTGSLVLSALV